jgi:hypothetical protein
MENTRGEGMMSWCDGKWNGTIRISEAIENKWWDKLESERTGVYRLIALDENGRPIPLNRVCGTDETGTLYVGASDRPLLNRLGSLVKTHRGEYVSKPHRELSMTLSKYFPDSRLGMTWEYTDLPWQREAELLMAYEAKFGELPPNNGQRSVIDRAGGNID